VHVQVTGRASLQVGLQMLLLSLMQLGRLLLVRAMAMLGPQELVAAMVSQDRLILLDDAESHQGQSRLTLIVPCRRSCGSSRDTSSKVARGAARKSSKECKKEFEVWTMIHVPFNEWPQPAGIEKRANWHHDRLA
jgi:hypothetical protein